MNIWEEWRDENSPMGFKKGLNVEERKRLVKDGYSIILDDINSVLAQDDRIKYKKEYRYYTEIEFNTTGYSSIDETGHLILIIYKDVNVAEIYKKKIGESAEDYPNEITMRLLKMSAQDSYPDTIQYDLGDTIEIKSNGNTYPHEIQDIDYTFLCVLHFSNNIILVSLDFNIYYFRQVGKDVYFINVPFAT
ncbi:hypothetical protein DCO58_12545 [Helicobacter saguini]|uniref:Uncharacterized protein n=1 Tax=Helicobacter saguini TaxID=1548018 RepID=A0A347VQM9_9HELI|nr:hypothetical protein [Helicobacter saguini]MWV60884.1 hypothetical protein [Helicobacter saguini]MWV68448.1 hypothetical protein [Helicobacter saguini]MWV70088.1 hypothetical protein [Helicobacter saguini]MWV71991.1 hypothetical protein [Helicobacter saguini]TLD91649.1 hypothetical protein LS64_011490 [Helicobacter saguini]